MNILHRLHARPTADGDGVNIKRIADFSGRHLDPFLMIDEIRSNDESDYVGGFPPHPHRGIETFTYMKTGGFEHRDHMGNRAAIVAGDTQWMSTGRGVLHSEMPLPDETHGIHGFQIWVNMAAADKMREPRYTDSRAQGNPQASNAQGATLRALAGGWQWHDTQLEAPINGLSANARIADLMLDPNGQGQLESLEGERLILFVYQGELSNPALIEGTAVVADNPDSVTLQAGAQGAGVLVFTGSPLNEPVAHMGPFVMNTEQELRQAVMDYQAGKFGRM
ncbi:pirin family protein [Fluctibacter halophilus]|uniref:pirin family protein n=1 Tax=Fluctibacter halophilus TaxID=226011 RepID=UPI00389939CF